MIWNMRLVRTLAVGALTLTLGASLATAQDTIDPTAQPAFGNAVFSPGMTPDPFIMTMTSGGHIDASTVAPTCTGYIASAPDFRWNWETASSHLRFVFVGEGDTTLVIQSPDGSFNCNDDGFELNPVVDIVNPVGGDYNIWVGSYRSDEFVPGYFLVSESTGTATAPVASSLLSGLLGVASNVVEPQVITDSIDPNAMPTFGAVTLASGFAPAPHTVTLNSGGTNNAGLMSLGAGCIGYVATNPDYSVNLSSAMAHLIIGFASTEGDTTLVVRGPAGNYTCNDDTHGFDPELNITNAAAGEYDIWVGSYSAGVSQAGTLYLSESANSGLTGVTGATSTPFVPTNVPSPTATPSK